MDEHVDLDELRFSNAELKREVARLSEDMDKIQSRRHGSKKKKAAHAAEAKVDSVPPEVRLAIKQNEDLRKERLKLTAELQHSDTGRRIAEVRNALAVVNRKIAESKEEYKSLENLRKARRSIVEMAQHQEDELRLFREQHRQELNGFKEEAGALTEESKFLDRQMIAMQVHVHRIAEKIKLGVNGEAFEEMKRKVEHQEAEIAGLEERISKVSGDIDKDTKRENRDLKELRAEKVKLQARIEELKLAQAERERELKISYNMQQQRGHRQSPRSA